MSPSFSKNAPRAAFLVLFILASIASAQGGFETPAGSALFTISLNITCVVVQLIYGLISMTTVLVVSYYGMIWLTRGSEPQIRRMVKDRIGNLFFGYGLIFLSGTIISMTIYDGQPFPIWCVPSSYGYATITACLLIRVMQGIASIMAITIVAWQGLRYVTYADNPAVRKMVKTNIITVLQGFFIVIFAIEFLNVVLSGTGVIGRVPCGGTGGEIRHVLCPIINIMRGFATILMLVMISIEGYNLLGNPGDYAVKKHFKDSMLAIVTGFVIVVLATQFLGALFYDSSMTEFVCGPGWRPGGNSAPVIISGDILVMSPHRMPWVPASAPLIPCPGDTMFMDASMAVSDPENDPLYYDWVVKDLGNGKTYLYKGVMAEHMMRGTCDVTLHVSDGYMTTTSNFNLPIATVPSAYCDQYWVY